jgi:drug/metabolite transporter (DMT)-like permease
VALCGLAVLYLPGAAKPPLMGVSFMLVAAVGWGTYSLYGRGSRTPLASTAANFIWASGLTAIVPWAVLEPTPSTAYGITLAVAAGALASGVGYTIWYAVLPHLHATRASVVQLSAPVLALMGGAIFLNEPLRLSAILAAGLVAVGVLIALRAHQNAGYLTSNSKGS